MLDATRARDWVARWDRQQERYLADREERFTVIGDVVTAALADRPAPRILDVGCGPGSLAARLARRLPAAEIVGVDADPVLLALAEAAHPAAARFAHADLRAADWPAQAGLAGPLDAALSTTALHWLSESDLGALYRRLGALVRPGGVLVNADHLYDDQPGVRALARLVRKARAARAGVEENEDWAAWWAAVEAAPELAGPVAQRRARGYAHSDEADLSTATHARLLRAAGFAEVGVVWRSGDDTVLVALR
ncbi:methyltransferase [Pilimelia terevasa]|uniref:Methyltransferase n=1 Tax=Pilimelia terevasa TaxID=53372 RepID=A0A8J3BRI2_9ACTN|nr:class I SAM-dependent methyltransferase [Pilimelia terevasa]GGK33685.1 methyltransferase [Pilimelia terevasa]